MAQKGRPHTRAPTLVRRKTIPRPPEPPGAFQETATAVQPRALQPLLPDTRIAASVNYGHDYDTFVLDLIDEEVRESLHCRSPEIPKDPRIELRPFSDQIESFLYSLSEVHPKADALGLVPGKGGVEISFCFDA